LREEEFMIGRQAEYQTNNNKHKYYLSGSKKL
jgi:hypothetical protein